MSKRVNITPKIQAMIRKAVDDPELDATGFAVFEALLVSTKPLIKRGSHFDKARISRNTLSEMAMQLETKGSVQMLTMHDGDELPVGRLLSADLVELDDGETALHGLFYIDATEEKLIAKIDNSTIDEVSIGLVAKHQYCSECDFDYRSEEASIMNFIERTCDNGHTLGEDGCHLRLVGVDQFVEVSLVGKGAAQDPKILSRTKQVMGEEKLERLAASGHPLEAITLSARFPMKLEANKGNEDMAVDFDKLSAMADDLANAKAEVKIKDHELGVLKASSEAKDTEIEELKASAEALKTELTELKAKGVSSEELEELKASVAKFGEFIKKGAEAALTAKGTGGEVPESVEDQLKLIEDSGVELHQLFAAGATSEALGSDADNKGENVDRSSAFKVM